MLKRKSIIIFAIIGFVLLWLFTGGLIIFNTVNIYATTFTINEEYDKEDFFYNVSYERKSLGVPFLFSYIYTKNPLKIGINTRNSKNQFKGINIHKYIIKYSNEENASEYTLNSKKFKTQKSEEGYNRHVPNAIKYALKINTPEKNIDLIDITIYCSYIDNNDKELPFVIRMNLSSNPSKYVSTTLYELSRM